MTPILSLLLVFVCTAIAGIRSGPLGAVMFFTIWTLGLALAVRLVSQFGVLPPGEGRAAEPVASVTGNHEIDFALSVLWPIGLPILLICVVARKVAR